MWLGRAIERRGETATQRKQVCKGRKVSKMERQEMGKVGKAT